MKICVAAATPGPNLLVTDPMAMDSDLRRAYT
jgi:hypothetical protein